MTTIGILALQGNFAQHRALLQTLRLHAKNGQQSLAKVRVQYVRSEADLLPCHGLIIPGGESTTMRNLLRKAALFSVLRTVGRNGFPLFGVCAGAILLATRIRGTNEQGLGILDIEVERNGYGRQVHSFEAEMPLILPTAGASSKQTARQTAETAAPTTTVSGAFIRAPIIRACADSVEVLARHAGTPVVVCDGSTLGATFHPEVKHDLALHHLFLTMCVDHTRVCADYLSSSVSTEPTTN